MKKSIPLKEIVGFLPYQLKWHLPLTSERFESILENECYGIIDLEWAIENNYPREADYLKMTFTQPYPFIAIEDNELFLGQMKSNLGWEEDDVYMSEMKPVMHPMSYLTKEITHNGEKIKPYELLFPIDGVDEMLCFTSIQYAESFLECKNPLEQCFPFEFWEKLKELHFDIYDWIKDGLAIDLNTL